MLEINPCVLTGDGKLVALDAKMTFDDNALFRHKELRELRDLDEEDPLEVEASKYGLNYIKLDGSVACMVNGAGLAMATMDIIKYAGGSPANFLDVGGGASAEQVKNAFRILMSDPAVKAVFINIFGGILRCDVLATGVVAAAKDLQVERSRRRSNGRNQRRARPANSSRQRLELHHRRRHEGRRAKSRGPRRRCAMSVLVNEKTRLHRPGLYRPRRHFSRAANDRVRHERSWRRHARQRRHETSRTPRVQHRRRCRESHRRKRFRDFRSAAVCR